MKSYTSLPSASEESHYEYAYSHQENDATGYVNPLVLNTDDVKYATIKDIDVTTLNIDVDNKDNVEDNVDNVNYLELSTL